MGLAGAWLALSSPAEAFNGCAAGTSKMAHNNAWHGASDAYKQNCKLDACRPVGKRNRAYIDYGVGGVYDVYDFVVIDYSATGFLACPANVNAGPWN